MLKDRSRKKWTTKEHCDALRMRREGKTDEEIGSALFRSKEGVETHFRWQDMTPAQKAAKAKYVREYRLKMGFVQSNKIGRPPGPAIHLVPLVRPDPDALAERDLAFSLGPRDLTALVCGDPLHGRSALDRR